MTSSALRSFSVVVAATAQSMGIGRKGDLPWRIAEDMQFFKHITTHVPPTEIAAGKINAVIMGRKTYESIPKKLRPLTNRMNVVLSRDPTATSQKLSLPADVLVAKSLEEALQLLGQATTVHDIFVIGGGSVYEEAVKLPQCAKVFLTEVMTDLSAEEFDTFFPTLSASDFRLSKRSRMLSDAAHSYRFAEYDRIDDAEFLGDDKASIHIGSNNYNNSSSSSGADETKHCTAPPTPDITTKTTATATGAAVEQSAITTNTEEAQYLNIVREIINFGARRGDRTGTGTRSKFGVQMRFSLRDGTFPLLTTKKVFWRGVAEELLWFVAGRTNGNLLREKGIHIWDGNGSREFLDSRGLQHREEMDLGPVYGFQWRHFGAEYSNMHADYSGQGVDQLLECVEKIKNCPEDRRIILTAWNPADLHKMALPPCHMFCQFYVANGELSCQMYQRSADMGLGVPFNIASYSLLTCMIAQVCGLKPGDFVHCIGDAHVYSNHVDALEEQLLRTPRAFPKLRINPDVSDIEKFEFSDFAIEDYNPYATIKMKMAV